MYAGVKNADSHVHPNLILVHSNGIMTYAGVQHFAPTYTKRYSSDKLVCGADPNEGHTKKDQKEIQSLGTEVPFLKEERSTEERHDDRTTAYKGHDRNH